MLKRYTRPPMDTLWTDEMKFECWLKVELAVIRARDQLGRIPAGTLGHITESLAINPESPDRIGELEQTFEHDMIAFVTHLRNQVAERGNPELGRYIHDGVTSYDIEDPAFVLLLRKAVEAVLVEVSSVRDALGWLAHGHRHTLMLGRTHGQYAHPTTFGHLLLVFTEALRRSELRLRGVLQAELSEAKLSGAIGNYVEVDPLLEQHALHILGLIPAKAETQILQRDRHAAVLGALAILAGSIEQIARTFWEMMRSDAAELREPRKAKQRGSSAMPQKRNPILTERLMGMARLVRMAALAGFENIATPEFRAIEQSSVERHIFPDAFSQVHYMLITLRLIVEGLEVFPEQMGERVENDSFGVWAAQRLRECLVERGVDPDAAYTITQQLCFMAADKGRHLRDLCIEERCLPGGGRIIDFIGAMAFDRLFDAADYVRRGVDEIYRRCEL